MQVRDFNANDDWRAFCFKTPELAREFLPKLDLIVEARNPRNYQQVVNKLPLMDFDKEFANDPEQRVIATGLETIDGSECSLEDIIKQVCQVSDGSLSFAASCKCGYLKGNYNEGTVCPKCKSICTTPFSDDVEFGGWLTIPETLPPFLHPSAYRILKAWMGTLFKRRMSILDSLLDPNVQLVGEYAKLGQGMSYFYNNFDDIINFIMNMKGRGVKAKEDELIKEFLNTYRNQLFVRHIPILDQSLHVLTKSGSMTYDDKSAEYILEAWLELDVVIRKLNNHPETNPIKIDKYVWRVYSAWIKYTESIITPKLAKKEGFIRKSCHGHRNHYTGRGVIAPMFLDAPPEVINIPWRMAVCIFKHEILNILQNRYGYDVNEACDLHMKGVVGYNQIIDSCLKTLWDESPFIGMPFLMGRNPELASVITRRVAQGKLWDEKLSNCWEARAVA